MKRTQKIFVILLAVFSLLLFADQARAASEFETRYNTTYQVSKSGLTTVRHQIDLKNKVSNIYAEKFSIAVGFTDLESIRVQDEAGTITPIVEKTQNQTIVRFDFLNKVVGKDKSHNFYIQYQTRDIANKNGSVWEVNIPKLETEKNVVENRISLIVPSEFGQPAYISPKPVKQTNRAPSDNVSNVYEFEGAVLNREAVSALFGRVQHMKLDLSYHLRNDSQSVSQMDIALPPDTSYQTMMYQSILPEPVNVREDKDGNWLAVYRLKPQEKIDVKVVAIARINFFPESSLLSDEKRSLYTQANEVWISDSNEINRLSENFNNPQAVYDYVVDYLNYDFDQAENATTRSPVNHVLNTKLAICTGYADLYVTLARAANIPSRELEGYALTNNDKLRPLSLKKDVLHSWVEYYDEQKNAWIQVDPTWADTTGGVDYFNKLDLNHVVFVIHGQNPHDPVPAGGYKIEGQEQKDVLVEAVEPIGFSDPKLEFKVSKELKNGQVVIDVINKGNTAYEGRVRIDSEPAGIIRDDFDVGRIPPWGSKKIQVTSDLPGRWNEVPVIIKFNYDQQTEEVSTSLEPPFKKKVQMAGTVIGLGGVLLAAAYWSRRIFF